MYHPRNPTCKRATEYIQLDNNGCPKKEGKKEQKNSQPML
jgi:hypothetical protein